MKLVEVPMKISMIAGVATLLLSGCGLAETTAVAASEASSAAEEAKRGKEQEAQVQRDIDAAQKTAAESRDKAEAE
jgi:hypothetical protein